jgi:5-methylcytosine-specific restriction enzyme A
MDRGASSIHAHRDVDGRAFERHQRQIRHRADAARAVKLCTVCGVVTSRAGSRCTDHARQSNRSRHNALYSTRAWQRLSARVLRAWRGQHGNWCPGYQRSAHPAVDLTVDHVVPLAAGGEPFGIGNCAVLCRSCNSTKGARDADRGSPHAGSALVEDRASHLYARGRVSREIPVAIASAGRPDTGAAPARVPPRTARDRDRAAIAPLRPQ